MSGRVTFQLSSVFSAQGQVFHCNRRNQGCSSVQRQVFNCKLRNQGCSSVQRQVFNCKRRNQGCSSVQRQVFNCKLRNQGCRVDPSGPVAIIRISRSEVRGFDPGWGRWIFQSGKILSMTSFGRELNPWVDLNHITELQAEIRASEQNLSDCSRSMSEAKLMTQDVKSVVKSNNKVAVLLGINRCGSFPLLCAKG